MAWSSIIDQTRVVATLRSSAAGGRIAHAYLFYGPDGVGKRAAALEFARTLLCERNGDEACGRCLSCTKVSRALHPDVHILMAHPKDTDPAEIGERLRMLAENPYAAVDFVRRPSLADPTQTSNKQSIYTVERMHEQVRRPMSFRPVEGRYKIAVITDADLMRVDAANTFLKVLEEPTPRTIFVLTSSRADRMLPTILSRCQRIRFDPLSAEIIAATLVAREGVEADLADTLARMADGSYTRAVELAESEDLRQGREIVVEYLRLAYARDIDKLSDLIDMISRIGRERIKGMLVLMLRWIRDLVLFRTTADESILVNIDQKSVVIRFVQNLPAADLEAMVSLVENAIELIGRNTHIPLTLTALAQSLFRAMRGPHSGRLYVPLVEERFSRAS